MTKKNASLSKSGFVIRFGSLRGFLYGVFLAEVYTLLFAAFTMGGSLLEGSTRVTFSEVFGGIFLVLFSGQFYGILPAGIIGLITGTLIAAMALHLSERGERAASNLGAFWSISITLLTHGGLILAGLEQAPFILLFGLPAVIYVGAAMIITKRSRRYLPDTIPVGRLDPLRLRIPILVISVVEIVLLLFYFFRPLQ